MRFFVFSVLRDAPARLFSPYMRHDSCVCAGNPEGQKSTAAPSWELRCKSKIVSQGDIPLQSPVRRIAGFFRCFRHIREECYPDNPFELGDRHHFLAGDLLAFEVVAV